MHNGQYSGARTRGRKCGRKFALSKKTGAHGADRHGKPRYVCLRTLQGIRCEARHPLLLRRPERQSARPRQARPRCLMYYSAPSRNIPRKSAIWYADLSTGWLGPQSHTQETINPCRNHSCCFALRDTLNPAAETFCTGRERIQNVIQTR